MSEGAHSFRLKPGAPSTVMEEQPLPHDAGFGDMVLLQNVAWFIRLRWIIAGMFLVFSGIFFFIADKQEVLRVSFVWPLVVAVVLAVVNSGYVMHMGYFKKIRPTAIHLNLWTQIVLDLMVVTVVVHMAGSQSTFAPFLYTLHIVLACVFFVPRDSFIVFLVSAALYGGCSMLEGLGILDHHCMYGDICQRPLPGLIRAIHSLSAIVIWASVWYLASRLSAILRARNLELNASQKRLKRTLQVGQQHMQQTAHQMKSPLAAIQSNLTLLEMELGESSSERSRDLMDRMKSRCKVLGEEIRDILHLSNLKAGDNVTREFAQLNVKELLVTCIESLQGNADGRNVQLKTDLEDVEFYGDKDVLKVLFDNLISNAINYSKVGGEASVNCRKSDDPAIAAVVTISDDGIGIDPERLPMIFEDYFRTEQAKKHCRHSSGMGLSIVKHAAGIHGIEIEVESELEKGTSFKLYLPIRAR